MLNPFNYAETLAKSFALRARQSLNRRNQSVKFRVCLSGTSHNRSGNFALR